MPKTIYAEEFLGLTYPEAFRLANAYYTRCVKFEDVQKDVYDNILYENNCNAVFVKLDKDEKVCDVIISGI